MVNQKKVKCEYCNGKKLQSSNKCRKCFNKKKPLSKLKAKKKIKVVETIK